MKENTNLPHLAYVRRAIAWLMRHHELIFNIVSHNTSDGVIKHNVFFHDLGVVFTYEVNVPKVKTILYVNSRIIPCGQTIKCDIPADQQRVRYRYFTPYTTADHCEAVGATVVAPSDFQSDDTKSNE